MDTGAIIVQTSFIAPSCKNQLLYQEYYIILLMLLSLLGKFWLDFHRSDKLHTSPNTNGASYIHISFCALNSKEMLTTTKRVVSIIFYYFWCITGFCNLYIATPVDHAWDNIMFIEL